MRSPRAERSSASPSRSSARPRPRRSRGAVESAKAKMSEAFDLKQKLDDEIEDTVHDRRAWHIRIIQICDEIDDILDENTEAFDALRKLEQNAPQELERVKGERAALAPLLAGAAPALAALADTYDATALVDRRRQPGAGAGARACSPTVRSRPRPRRSPPGRSGEAAFAIRTAEQSVAQAAQLVQAITALGAELTSIEAQAQALVAGAAGRHRRRAAAARLGRAIVLGRRGDRPAAAAGRRPASPAAARQPSAGARRAHRGEHADRRRDRTGHAGRRARPPSTADARADADPGRLRDPRDPRVHRDAPRHGRIDRTHAAVAGRSLAHAGAEPARIRPRGGAHRGRPRTRSRPSGHVVGAGRRRGDEPEPVPERRSGAGRGGSIFGGWPAPAAPDLGGDILGGIIGGLLSGGGGGGGSSPQQQLAIQRRRRHSQLRLRRARRAGAARAAAAADPEGDASESAHPRLTDIRVRPSERNHA